MSQSFDIGLTPEKSFTVDLNVSGGTDNYEKLKNLPTLNGVELKGTLTSVDVGVVGRDEIPPVEEIATKSEIPDVSGFASKSDLDEKQDKGDYALTSQLPTKTSQLVNDSDFALKSEIPEIPTKVSAFENDMGYLTQHQNLDDYALKSEIPTKVSAFENDMGYLTQHQDISNLATKAELNSKADKIDVPTKTSQLTNDSGFLTEYQDISYLATKSEVTAVEDKIPDVSGFATKTELSAKQDKGDYALKSDIPDVSGKAEKETVETLLAQTTLANKTIFRANEMVSVELLIPSTIDDDFLCEVDFTSGATATAFTMVDTVKWRGDDITDGSFVPVANKRYSVLVWFDGTFVRAESEGVEL